jgi:putative membrane protein
MQRGMKVAQWAPSPGFYKDAAVNPFRNRFAVSLAVILASAAGLALAGGDKDKADMQPLTNTSFVTKAVQANLAEVEMSKLALSKTQDEQVRSFAQRMVQDHEKASAELKPIARKHGIQVPAKVDEKHAKKLESLKAKNGAAFDAEYSKLMMKDHDKAVRLFTKASQETQLHADLRNFATKTLPTLQSHHQMANRLPGGETRSASSADRS